MARGLSTKQKPPIRRHRTKIHDSRRKSGPTRPRVTKQIKELLKKPKKGAKEDKSLTVSFTENPPGQWYYYYRKAARNGEREGAHTFLQEHTLPDLAEKGGVHQQGKLHMDRKWKVKTSESKEWRCTMCNAPTATVFGTSAYGICDICEPIAIDFLSAFFLSPAEKEKRVTAVKGAIARHFERRVWSSNLPEFEQAEVHRAKAFAKLRPIRRVFRTGDAEDTDDDADDTDDASDAEWDWRSATDTWPEDQWTEFLTWDFDSDSDTWTQDQWAYVEGLQQEEQQPEKDWYEENEESWFGDLINKAAGRRVNVGP